MSNKLLCYRWGAHASTTDWTTAPTLANNTPTNNPVFDLDYNYVQRSEYQQCDGDAIGSIQSGKNVALPDLSFELHGLSGSGAGDAVAASGLSHGLETAFDMLASSVVNGTGDTSAAAGNSGTTLATDTGAPWALGELVLAQGATSGKLQARRITAKSGTNNTLSAALTTDAGVAEDPADSAVVYAGKNYFFDGTTPDHTHMYIDAEGDGWRYTANGVFASGALSLTPGGLAMLNLSGVTATDWATASPASPGYTAPTQGSPIPVVDCPVWINGSLFMAYDIEVDFGVQFAPRRSDGGPNGHWGGVVEQVRPSVNFKLRAGSLSMETSEATMETYRADGTEEVLIQIGRTAGKAMAIYIGACRLEVKPIGDGMLRAYQVTGTPTYHENAPASNPTAPMQVTIF